MVESEFGEWCGGCFLGTL